MSQIAVRLSDDELRQLDSIVIQSGFRTRADAVRAGIRKLGAEAREQRISSAYALAYERTPLTDDETHMLDSAIALAAELPK
jgi:Arc/MetJ-type ribon-helix-helix transcriptional regulator